MDRAMAMPDLKPVGRRNRGADPALGLLYGLQQGLAFRQARRNRRGQRAAGAMGIGRGQTGRSKRYDLTIIHEIIDAL